MQQTGSILKKAREEAGLSLQEVSLSLKISSRVIQAIEEADEKKLPAKTFLRGFVKSYANLLKLDEAHILEVFYTEVGTTVPKLNISEGAARRGETVDVSRPKPELKEPVRAKAPESAPTSVGISETPTSENVTSEGGTPTQATTEKSFAPHKQNIVEPSLKPIDQNRSPKTAILTVVAVILVVLIIGTQQIIKKYSKEASIPTDSSAMVANTQGTDDSAPLSADAVTAATQAEAPMTPAAGEAATGTESSPATATQQESAASPAASVDSTKPILPVPTTLQKEEAKKEAPVTPAINEPKAGFPKVVVPAGKPIELIVEAMEGVEIEYSSKNGKKSSIKLTPEQVHTFKSKDGLNVRISNGGAVNLILNGRDLGIPGDSGKSINLSY